MPPSLRLLVDLAVRFWPGAQSHQSRHPHWCPRTPHVVLTESDIQPAARDRATAYAVTRPAVRVLMLWPPDSTQMAVCTMRSMIASA